MKDLAIISLKYLEEEYKETLECLKGCGYDVFYADRDYVGNMSRAFNDCFIKHVKGKYSAVWFITNIKFEAFVPLFLYNNLISNNLSVIHPAFNSDHKHIQPDGSGKVKEVNYIEFTAPMFLCEHFEKFLLDENCWYYWFDLIISKDFRENGLKMGVDHFNQIQHVYLRNNKKKSQISVIRAKLRDTIINPINERYMKEKYGKSWQQEIWLKWR
jgi:hypothetical protein